MLEGESGLNWVAASAANHSGVRHSCKLSYLQMEQFKCQKGGMAVRIINLQRSGELVVAGINL